MTREEKLAYARGYNAGIHGKWPDFVAPVPPEPVMRRLIEAVGKIRAESDSLQSVFSPDDEVVKTFDRMIDEADAAAEAVTRWFQLAVSEAAS